MRRTVLLLAALACSSAAQAQIDIRVDLSNLAGTTAGNWNNIGAAAALTTNLINFSNGAATGVSLNGSGSSWVGALGDTSGAFASADWMLTSAAADGFSLLASTTGTYTFANLPAGGYIVEVVSARTQPGAAGTFTVNGTAANRTFRGTPVVNPWNATTHGLDADNWLIWDNVTATGGTIAVQLVTGTAGPGIMDAIRVRTVPAPGAAMMLVAGLGLMARRRRRA